MFEPRHRPAPASSEPESLHAQSVPPPRSLDDAATAPGCLTIEQAFAYMARADDAPPASIVEQHLDVCERCRLLLGEAARADSEDVPASGSPMHRPLTLEIGEVVGNRYELVRFLASGGMGEV